MISREQLKLEIDSVDDATIEILHRIVLALKNSLSPSKSETFFPVDNPLKNSVIYEKDIISPIDEVWDVAQ